MANSADPDQLLLQKPTDLDLHCLQNRVYPGSAGQGLIFSMLHLIISRQHLIFFVLLVSKKYSLTVHDTCFFFPAEVSTFIFLDNKKISRFTLNIWTDILELCSHISDCSYKAESSGFTLFAI